MNQCHSMMRMANALTNEARCAALPAAAGMMRMGKKKKSNGVPEKQSARIVHRRTRGQSVPGPAHHMMPASAEAADAAADVGPPERLLSGWIGKTLGGAYPAAGLNAELFKLQPTTWLQLLESSKTAPQLSTCSDEARELLLELAEMGFSDNCRALWAIKETDAVRNACVKLLVSACSRQQACAEWEVAGPI